jgi:hypothetical protein
MTAQPAFDATSTSGLRPSFALTGTLVMFAICEQALKFDQASGLAGVDA